MSPHRTIGCPSRVDCALCRRQAPTARCSSWDEAGVRAAELAEREGYRLVELEHAPSAWLCSSCLGALRRAAG